MNDELVFTPSAVISFLSEIEELKGLDISYEETSNGVTISIGSSSYVIKYKDAAVVEIGEEPLEAISEVNEEGYDSIESSSESIEGGIIKQIAKTLLIGGLVRLSAGMLKGE